MTPSEFDFALRSFGLSRRQFAELFSYPKQTVDSWAAPGRSNVPLPPAMVALMILLRDMSHEQRQVAFAKLRATDLRGQFRPLVGPVTRPLAASRAQPAPTTRSAP